MPEIRAMAIQAAAVNADGSAKEALTFSANGNGVLALCKARTYVCPLTID